MAAPDGAVFLVSVLGVMLVALLVAEASRRPLWMGLTKPVTSALFVALAVVLGALSTPYGRIVLVALGLSWVGDLLLVFRSRGPFLGGLSAFLAAHVAFTAAFLRREWDPQALVFSCAVLGLLAIGIGLWLLPRVEARLRGPVIGYMVVISVMVAAAVSATVAGVTAWVLWGALAFYVSDLLVARDRFVQRAFVNRVIGLPLYYGAQVALAWTVAL